MPRRLLAGIPSPPVLGCGVLARIAVALAGGPARYAHVPFRLLCADTCREAGAVPPRLCCFAARAMMAGAAFVFAGAGATPGRTPVLPAGRLARRRSQAAQARLYRPAVLSRCRTVNYQPFHSARPWSCQHLLLECEVQGVAALVKRAFQQTLLLDDRKEVTGVTGVTVCGQYSSLRILSLKTTQLGSLAFFSSLAFLTTQLGSLSFLSTRSSARFLLLARSLSCEDTAARHACFPVKTTQLRSRAFM